MIGLAEACSSCGIHVTNDLSASSLIILDMIGRAGGTLAVVSS
jgi:hypothetical protein